ncbi:VanW family protein [Candidatus Peregrinibacteria bacterium]|nr:VanW family protein [Candidatus Peregrinibacteria bacterium]
MKNRKKLIGIITTILAGLTLATGLGFYKHSLVGKFPPGTQIANTDISTLTFIEAKKQLFEKGNKYLETPITIEILGKSKKIKPKELGINVSLEEPLNTVTTTSLTESGLLNIFNFGTKQNKSLFALANIDDSKLSSALENNFKLSEIAPKSASASFNDNGDFVVTDGRQGTTIDKEALLKDLKYSAQNLQNNTIKITTFNQKPPVTKEDILSREEKIKAELNQLITLEDPIYSDDWQIRLKKHPDWINFVPKKEVKIPALNDTIFLDPAAEIGRTTVSLEINQQKLNQFVDENISKWLDRPSRDVKIYTDEKGKIIIEGRGSDGKRVQREQLKRAIELAAENGIDHLAIPTISTTPKIEISLDLQAKGIVERLAVGHTSYYGSPDNRVFNIKHGAEKFNGALIAPDEIFSFNKTLGRVDDSTGFRKELVIKPEGTIPDFGGGICQVSTTMYRAALFSGLPITERNQHTYAVSYYSQILGHGLDATIFLGGPDLKFKNDTGRSVLIQTYTEGDYELYIVFYGTPDGRRVQMEGPYLSDHVNPPPDEIVETTDLPVGVTKLLEHSHPGFRALWYRHLFDKNGKETKEPIETNYKAMPEKTAIGVRQDTP